MPRTLVAAVAYVIPVFALGALLGTARVLVLAPGIGETRAVLLELPLMLAASWVVAGAVLRRWPGARPLGLGLAALALLLAAEMALGFALSGRPPAAWLVDQARLPGALGLAGQVMFGLIPWARAQRSG